MLRARRDFVWSALAVLVVALAAGLMASARFGEPASASNASAPAGATALQQGFITVLGHVRASVVEISTPQALGSGVVYDNKGHIVTNAHVVAGASRLQVTLPDGRTLDATLVGEYAPDDLAVVKVSGASLAPATFADSSKVQVGDIALAIGNPLGLASSVTNGIVSATGRTVSEGHGVVLPSTIQTSADINPGNSGGGLVDLDAQVIGIPTLAATDPQLGGGSAPGIGFAIPSNTVKLIADQLIASGTVTNSDRASLGITGTTVHSSAGQPGGVLVRTAGQPASGAGINAGDVITAINGTATPTLADLGSVLAGLTPGRPATVKVTQADGRNQSYRLTLGTL
jgi:putative serine protease PepD